MILIRVRIVGYCRAACDEVDLGSRRRMAARRSGRGARRHTHTMMAFPGQVLMEYTQGERPVPYLHEFLERRMAKCRPTIGRALASASTRSS